MWEKCLGKQCVYCCLQALTLKLVAGEPDTERYREREMIHWVKKEKKTCKQEEQGRG